MQQQKGSGSEIEVTWEDQLNINKFGRLNNRFHELEDEIKIAKVCELNGPVVDKLLGTIVHNEKEAYDLYNYYAHHIGFSVRKDHVSYWPNTKNIKSRDFLCSKAGLKRTPNLNSKVKFQKSDIRTGCAAMIRFVVDIDGNWAIKKFIETHNHSLANPVDHHLLRSNRGISEEKGAVLKSMTEAGIRATDAFNYLVEEVGGVENVGFSKRDAFNFIQKERRARIENGDTNSLIQLFKERQTEDNMFAWDVQIDKSDRLLNFFWSDGLARVDYDCFGDVIIFDTSYRLNKYNLVCAPFVGVNHHWQNILFGVAFLSEETIESYTWLFKTFLRVMDEKHPLTIFTNQDQAMARAIEVVLPNTRHRLCQWHISKKLPSKVHCFNNNKTVQSLFYICMSKCDSEEEFEQTWSKMIQKGNLQDHAWLSELYRIKSQWSTAFNKDSFCMEILSTQHSESANNICHGISKPTSSITDCFLGLEKVMSTWRRNEQDEDFRCSQSAIVPIVKSSPILKQAAAFYSRKLYSFFEVEFLNGVGGLSVEVCDNTTTKYVVRNLENKETSKCWVVQFDKTCLDISCSCKKFEMMGLLCAHCIRVLSHQDIVKIPEKYLIMRWSSRARRDIYTGKTYRDFKEMQVKSGASTGLIFRNHVSKYSYQISTKAQYNKEAEQYMLESLKKLSDDIDLILSGKSARITQVTKKRKIAYKDSNLKDPAKMQPNVVSNARLKGQWEKGKRVNKKNTEQSPTLVDDIQSSIGTTCSIMPTCLSEENNESLEDASNELILSDEDIVRFQIGEVFAHMPREEVESRLENMKEDSTKELEKLEEEKESVLAQMADLKKVLYGKFKDSINLEED